MAIRRSNHDPRIELAPLIDVVFLLLIFFMVATTFAADTPIIVAGFVIAGGIAKNWLWWSFLFGGTLTVFVFSSDDPDDWDEDAPWLRLFRNARSWVG